MKFDFSGYATKNNLKCTDGVTIRQGAFSNDDGNIVPLVWNHLHDDPEAIIGKAYLEHREDGTYAYCSLNGTQKAETVRELVKHGDINSMSIYATHVIKQGNDVVHGEIKEVSLVLSPANPGATIEGISISHGDGSMTPVEDECIIRHSGMLDEYDPFDLDVEFYDENGSTISHADDEKEDDDGETIQDVVDSMTEKQRNTMYALIGAALAEEKKEISQSDKGGEAMKFNAFEQGNTAPAKPTTLSHSDIQKVATMTFNDCHNNKMSFKNALKHAAQTYGIQNIDLLFPDAQELNQSPEFVKRRTEWVSQVISGTKHTPFSHVKTTFADITADEARARGYIKGKQKFEEIFPILKRSTGPQTIYKKQKLDNDDIIDISTFDVVAWLRAEMRLMLEEELARAILIGDGREVSSDDKIKEDCIRPIWTDDPFYAPKLQLKAGSTESDLADAFVRSRLHYEGSGRPVTFMSPETVTELMLLKDKDGYRMYKTETELADALRVSKIIEVPAFYGKTRTVKVSDSVTKTYRLDAIIVNLNDYSIGTNKGGQLSSYEDFDIDYNQHKYLIETRCSGALTGYHTAVVIETEITASESSAASQAKMAAAR